MTTDTDQAAKLAALRAKRSTPSTKTRRRPAEASRILVAGAGISAMLSLVTVMARADLAATSQDSNANPAAVYEEASSTLSTSAASNDVDRAQMTKPNTAQSVTVVRVATPRRTIGRSSGSR